MSCTRSGVARGNLCATQILNEVLAHWANLTSRHEDAQVLYRQVQLP